jgi:hypothetical protein
MKSFLQGKKPLSIAALRLPSGLASSATHAHTGAAPRTSPATGGSAGPADAHVEVVKEGDKVVRLVITCACGERIEVECLYPMGS